MNTHLRDHNHPLNDDEQAKLIVEKITANMEMAALLKRHRSQRWNWFSKIDPELTMFVVILLFGAAWVLRTVWVMQ